MQCRGHLKSDVCCEDRRLSLDVNDGVFVVFVRALRVMEKQAIWMSQRYMIAL